MTTMTMTLIAVVAVLLAGFLIFVARRPDRFTVSRSIVVGAPAQRVHALINDFGRWGEWSPYEGKDPAMQRAFGVTTAGEGATYAWEGNREVGQGNMRILESSPSRIRIQLEFLKPFRASNVAEFTLEPADGATRVTWAMHGPAPFVTKLMGLLCNLDRMIGSDFEVGLAAIKTIVDGSPVDNNHLEARHAT